MRNTDKRILTPGRVMGPQSIQLDKEKSEDVGKENTKRNNRRKLVFVEEMQASPGTWGRINLTRLTEL